MMHHVVPIVMYLSANNLLCRVLGRWCIILCLYFCIHLLPTYCAGCGGDDASCCAYSNVSVCYKLTVQGVGAMMHHDVPILLYLSATNLLCRVWGRWCIMMCLYFCIRLLPTYCAGCGGRWCIMMCLHFCICLLPTYCAGCGGDDASWCAYTSVSVCYQLTVQGVRAMMHHVPIVMHPSATTLLCRVWGDDAS